MVELESTSSIDRLGDRLRGALAEADLKALDTYRLGFARAYESVFQAVRRVSGVEVSGRPAKSTTAIVDKLRRESIRLSQIQDIAGCRVVVPSLAAQDAFRDSLKIRFPVATISDRRLTPSNGYRAVHVIVSDDRRLVEVQVRTSLQHAWAELSEKLADEFGIEIKYGGGSRLYKDALQRLSECIDDIESIEYLAKVGTMAPAELDATKHELAKMMRELTGLLKEKNDISNRI